MKNYKNLLLLLCTVGLFIACNDDDDGGSEEEIRDRAEVYAENIADLEAYLATHTYNYDEYDPANTGDFEIAIDTITAENADRTPLIDRPELKRYSITRDEIDYDYFVLEVREGGGERKPTFADSVLASYRGLTLSGEEFDRSNNAIWFDLPGAIRNGSFTGGSIEGFTLGLNKFNEATEISQNVDGTITYENSGIGAVFMPSGLAYFNNPPSGSGIEPYESILFIVKVRNVELTDHDGDGILSFYEDLNEDQNLFSSSDDTDGDGLPNYLDADDDNDGISTRDELRNDEGEIVITDGNPVDAPDGDGDGIPDYLDNSTQS